MESSVWIVFLLILIRCFALLLAWLSAGAAGGPVLKLTLLPQPPGGRRQDIRVESGDACFVLSVCADAQAPRPVSSPAPADGADPV